MATKSQRPVRAGVASGQHPGRGHLGLQPGAQQRAAERRGRGLAAARRRRADRVLAPAHLAAAAPARPRRQRGGGHGRHHEPAGGRRWPRWARQLLRPTVAPALEQSYRARWLIAVMVSILIYCCSSS